jgi:hypothetical protein
MKLVLAMLVLFFATGLLVRRITPRTLAVLLLGIGVILLLTRLTFR